MNAFETESELTQAVLKNPDFIDTLRSSSDGEIWQKRELKGLFGIPDLVIAFVGQDFEREKIRTFAFEMKRSNWKRALVQAFRYSSFADFSYVLMDRAYVHRALAHLDKFKRSNIGLASISKTGEVTWHYRPKPSPPYSKSLRQTLESRIKEDMYVEAYA
jgi:hypothetical protein